MTEPSDPNVEQSQLAEPPSASSAGGYAPAAEGYAPPVPAVAYGQHGGGGVGTGTYLDQVSGLPLPQGLELASVGRRIGAFFLSIPLAIVTLFIGYAIWGLIVWGNGQTPALQVLGMRCYRPETDRVPGWPWMALREVTRAVVGWFMITDLISFLFMLGRRDRETLHDMVAGTVVLRDPSNALATYPRQ